MLCSQPHKNQIEMDWTQQKIHRSAVEQGNWVLVPILRSLSTRKTCGNSKEKKNTQIDDGLIKRGRVCVEIVIDLRIKKRQARALGEHCAVFQTYKQMYQFSQGNKPPQAQICSDALEKLETKKCHPQMEFFYHYLPSR